MHLLWHHVLDGTQYEQHGPFLMYSSVQFGTAHNTVAQLISGGIVP